MARAAARVDPGEAGFIDESAVKTTMTRRYGRAKCGHRLVAAVPHGHWKTTTFVGALRCDGLTAPLVIDGAINGELFLQGHSILITSDSTICQDAVEVHGVAP